MVGATLQYAEPKRLKLALDCDLNNLYSQIKSRYP